MLCYLKISAFNRLLDKKFISVQCLSSSLKIFFKNLYRRSESFSPLRQSQERGSKNFSEETLWTPNWLVSLAFLQPLSQMRFLLECAFIYETSMDPVMEVLMCWASDFADRNIVLILHIWQVLLLYLPPQEASLSV